MKEETPHQVQQRLARAERIRLFLDYDGTLAEFAPTPEHVRPDLEVVSLIGRLAQNPRFRVAVVSGRRLGHVQKLVPVPGVLLAGTYGVELLMPEGTRIDRLDYDGVRPTLDTLKPRWADLIAGRVGYFLEDKGWALALHARFADEAEYNRVLDGARRLAEAAMRQAAPDLFRLLGGHKFLEIGPKLAHKGLAVEYLLDQFPWHGAVPLYLGDDDKDEEAFGVIKARGGIAVVVAAEPRETEADLRLESPYAARGWLRGLVGS
ncbi:MAG: trehalose-phosphatase [Anaerolineae bacterium]|nr:trehalose-phosphatase [Anaerolineae bacterium]